MKKVLIMFFAVVGMMAMNLEVKAKEIIGLTACGKGMFGYGYTNWDTKSYVDGNGKTRLGWVGTCFGKGWQKCTPPKQNAPVLNDNVVWDQADQYDLNIANSKIEEIEGLIYDDLQPSGSITLTHHIVGQTFNRHYTFNWTSVVDEDGEICVEINVDMIYVEI